MSTKTDVLWKQGFIETSSRLEQFGVGSDFYENGFWTFDLPWTE